MKCRTNKSCFKRKKLSDFGHFISIYLSWLTLRREDPGASLQRFAQTQIITSVQIDTASFGQMSVGQMSWLKVNGRESTVNRLLDGSIYPGQKLVPFSLKFHLLGVKKYNNLFFRGRIHNTSFSS
jgi:hypothetical protein